MPVADGDLGYNPGASATPDNDTDPIIGAIQTGTELSEATANLVIKNIPIPESANVLYYGGYYRRNKHASLSLNGAKVCNRAGAILNANIGVFSAWSSSDSDTGKVRVVGKESSLWNPEEVTLVGDDLVSGSRIWDLNSVYRYEYLVGGAPAQPVGNITCMINGVTCAVIYGTASRGGGIIMCSAEHAVALATAKDTTISAANRKTAPTGLSSFSQAVRWSGLDQSLAVPGNVLEITKYIGVCLRLEAVVNIPVPIAGYVTPDILLYGT